MIRGPLSDLRRRLAELPPPVILYNKSHSGSALLSRALMAQEIFLGAERNASEDALPILKLVEHVVEGYYPDFGRLWLSAGDDTMRLASLAEEAFERHFAGYDRKGGGRWGWKLCESLYALPFFDFLFPKANVVHLVRDGRDVAWCDHVAPELPFWKKIYFNSDRIRHGRGLPLTNASYERTPHLYNAIHWANSVTIGRAYGSMLRERYLELRYEDLCGGFSASIATLMTRLGAGIDERGIARLAPTVHMNSIGKHRTRSRRAQRAVLRLIEPELAAFGYVDQQRQDQPRARWPWTSGLPGNR